MNKQDIIKYLQENYTEVKVAEMLDEEITNWVEDGWEDEYESEFDAYVESSRGEAESAIRQALIDQVRAKVGQDLDYETLDCAIRDVFSMLDK